MPRPKRPRCILSRPVIRGFRPDGAPKSEEVMLSLEEFEAIRHIDFEGMDQSQAADIMNVSRQTFGRILKSARFTVSNALVNACHLKIEGGCYRLHDNGQGHCRRRGHGRGRRKRGGSDKIL